MLQTALTPEVLPLTRDKSPEGRTMDVIYRYSLAACFPCLNFIETEMYFTRMLEALGALGTYPAVYRCTFFAKPVLFSNIIMLF